MADRTLDVVFTASHPDDIEIGSGGTVASLVKLGYRVGMVHMTNGETTPRGTPEIRAEEMRAAAERRNSTQGDRTSIPTMVTSSRGLSESLSASRRVSIRCIIVSTGNPASDSKARR